MSEMYRVNVPQHLYLFEYKTIIHGAMQVDGHGANLRQQDVETLDRVVFELRKHKGFELTVFLEAPKPFSTLGKSEPGVMPSPNRGLQDLRMN
jgi:hypothetical protein